MKLSLYLFLLALVMLSACSKDQSSANGPSGTEQGVAGSLARFALVSDYLYAVTNTNIKIFDVKQPSIPSFTADKSIGFNIETIFPLGNTLFIGSQNGMYIYDITNPANPSMQSLYSHITSCDPVVADDKFAYVTLSTDATRCNRGLNQLEVIDIGNKKAPKFLQAIQMVKPKGLALSGNDLFVCDDKVKWFDVTNSPTLVSKGTINVRTHDAIIVGKILMLVGDNGLSQYDISTNTPTLLSEIKVGK